MSESFANKIRWNLEGLGALTQDRFLIALSGGGDSLKCCPDTGSQGFDGRCFRQARQTFEEQMALAKESD